MWEYLGSYETMITPINANKIKNHFLIDIFSFKKMKLKIRPKGTVNWVPIIIGDTSDEISNAKYRVT